MHLRRLRYPLRIAVLLAATLLSTSAASRAWAADIGTPLQPGWVIERATVVCPGQPHRTLTSVQAATFLQSWLPDAIYSKLKNQDPPPGIVRCTVTVPWTIAGQPPQVPAQIGFATNGTRVWIRAPPNKWSIAIQTQRVINSFLGHGTYIPIPTTTTAPAATTSPGTTPRGTPRSHGSSKTWAWLAVPVAGGALIVFARLRSRRGQTPPIAVPSPRNPSSTKGRG